MERTLSPVTAGDPATAGRLLERLGDRFAEETGLTSRVETTLRSGCPTDVEVTLLRAAQLGIIGLGGEADRTGP